MTKLQKLCTLLILFSLTACDDQAAKPAATAQDFPQFDSFQPTSEIDQLKARLFDNPTDFNTLATLANKYFEAARYLESVQTYDKALAVNPNCANCLNDRGLALFYSGDPDAAIGSFERANTVDPGYVHAWLSKGFVLVSAGRYEEAIAPLNKVKELDTTGQLAAEADKFLATAVAGNVQ